MITAKEKAKEIVDKYLVLLNDYQVARKISAAKQCALTEVAGIIDSNSDFGYSDTSWRKPYKDKTQIGDWCDAEKWWSQVKHEIEIYEP
jgi:hypothetical protein